MSPLSSVVEADMVRYCVQHDPNERYPYQVWDTQSGVIVARCVTEQDAVHVAYALSEYKP